MKKFIILFRTSSEIVSGCFSKLHSACPEKHFGVENFFENCSRSRGIDKSPEKKSTYRGNDFPVVV